MQLDKILNVLVVLIIVICIIIIVSRKRRAVIDHGISRRVSRSIRSKSEYKYDRYKTGTEIDTNMIDNIELVNTDNTMPDPYIMNLTPSWRYIEDVDTQRLCLQSYSNSNELWIDRTCYEPIIPNYNITSNDTTIKNNTHTIEKPKLNIAVVIDVSGSITHTELENIDIVRGGIKKFIDGIGLSPSKVAISSFSTRSPAEYHGSKNSTEIVPGGYFSLNYDADVSTTKLFINNYLNFSKTRDGTDNTSGPDKNYTNWQEGLISAEGPGVNEHFNGPLSVNPDIIIFITDGQPNAYLTSTIYQDQPLREDPTINPRAKDSAFFKDDNFIGIGNSKLGLSLAQEEAYYIRKMGTRIIGVGIGEITHVNNDLNNLISITTNSRGRDNGPLLGADYFIAPTFSEFDTAIDGIIVELGF